MTNEPIWLFVANKYLGLAEVKGTQHNPVILNWWAKIRAPFTTDETPWCAAFVGGVLEQCGIKSSRSAAARSYLKWGKPLLAPAVGCIVVFWRSSPTSSNGHVGFVVGKDEHDNLMVLGGNQGDAVNVKPFSQLRVLSYRWPNLQFVPITRGFDSLPVIASNSKLSENEA